MTAIAIALLSAAGALGRVLATRRLGGGARATLAVNVAGSATLGLLVGAGAGDDLLLYAGTGALGSFTTFSTWMVEADRIARHHDLAPAARLLVLATLSGAAALAAGWAIGSLA